MNVALCPYCGGDLFSSEVIRADAVNPENPERYAKIEGYWFNLCLSCDGWSVYKEGKQYALDNKQEKPKAYSLPTV